MKKTRAIQILDDLKVPHEVRSYDSEGFATAVEVAQKLGLPPEAVFKTLVARGDRSGVMMALVPADKSLSLRKLAHLGHDKRVEMVNPDELPRLTGYIKGGVSPLGGKRAYPTFLDRSVLQHERISVSAGVRGVQILIAPSDLARLTRAILDDLTE